MSKYKSTSPCDASIYTCPLARIRHDTSINWASLWDDASREINFNYYIHGFSLSKFLQLSNFIRKTPTGHSNDFFFFFYAWIFHSKSSSKPDVLYCRGDIFALTEVFMCSQNVLQDWVRIFTLWFMISNGSIFTITSRENTIIFHSF